MAEVKIGINGGGGSAGGGGGGGGVDKQTKDIEKLAKALSQVGAEVAKLSKLNFEPPSIKDFQRDMGMLNTQWKQAIAAMPQLRRAMQQTGQSGASISNLDFAKLTPNPATAERWRKEAYNRMSAGTAYDFSVYNNVNSTGHAIPATIHGPTNAEAANARAKTDASNAKVAEKNASKIAKDADKARLREDVADERAKTRAAAAETRKAAREDTAAAKSGGRAWRGAAGSIGTAVGTAAGVGGGIGQVIGGGISGAAGALSGGAGIGGMIGGGLVGMITGGIAMAAQFASHGVELAGNRAGDADTLKRQMGDLGTSFNDLIAGTEKFNQGLGVSSAQFAKLELSAASASGGLYRTPGEVGRATAGGAGFARGFGMDPSQGIQALSGMQRMDTHATTNELAVKLANAINGAQGKALPAEVVSIIQGIASQQNRLTADSPNVDRIGNMFTSLLHSIPGMTASHAAGIFGQANGATQHMMGNEATANLAMRSFGGLDPIQAEWLVEGGMGATVDSRLGKGSDYAGWTGNSGMRGKATVAGMLMKQMRSDLGITGEKGNEQQQEFLASGIKKAFGLNSMDDAVALSKMSSGDTDGLMGFLKKSNVDINSMNPESIPRMTALSKTDTFGGVDKVYQDMRGGLSDSDRDVLDKKEAAAKNGSAADISDFKSEIGRVSAGMGQSDDLGTNMRQAASDLDDIATNIGQRIAPSITNMEMWLEGIAKKMLGIKDEQMGPPKPDVAIHGATSMPGVGANAYSTGTGGFGSDQSSSVASLKGYLMSKGMDDAHASGILGNAMRESSLDATKWNPEHTMYGLFQLNGANRKAYDEWAKKNKRASMFDSSARDQIDFTMSQIGPGGSEYSRMGAFRDAKTAGVAGTTFDSGYERPASLAQENPIRFDLANQIAQIAPSDRSNQSEHPQSSPRNDASYGGPMGGMSGAGANITVVLEHTANTIADGKIKSRKETKRFHAPAAQGSSPRFKFSTDNAGN
jgi:hypothetical protein